MFSALLIISHPELGVTVVCFPDVVYGLYFSCDMFR